MTVTAFINRVLFALLIFVLVFVSNISQAYQVNDGKVQTDSGETISLHGVNWFGFETSSHVVHGIWERNWQDMAQQISDVGFNAVRLPVCPETLYGVEPSSIDTWVNSDLKGLNSLEILELVVKEFDRLGVYTLLDLHSPDCSTITPLWYTDSYSEEQWISDLVFMAEYFSDVEHFVGIDLKNEPHDDASWGTDDVTTDWRLAAEKAAEAVLEANPNILVFVQGIQSNDSCSPGSGHWWGGNLEPIACYPLNIPSDKLVLSPHVYGIDVYEQSYFNDENFPENMPAIWDEHFGFASDMGYTVIVGEFGSKYGHDDGDPRDVEWMDELVSYLLSKEMTDFFYWSWNPNSGDTGGILQDDWETVWDDKLAALSLLMNAVGEPEETPEEDDGEPEVTPDDECKPRDKVFVRGKKGEGRRGIPPKCRQKNIKIAAIGDFGSDSSGEEEVADMIKAWGADYVITLGDNNYAEPEDGEEFLKQSYDVNVGKNYHEFMYPYTGAYGEGSSRGYNQFYPCLGNHDWDLNGDNDLEEPIYYVDYFTLPGNERYYDVNINNRNFVHLFCIDSDYREPDGRKSDSEQAAWFKEKIEASQAMFKVVYVHHPPYSSGESHGSNEKLQWPYQEWGADIVLSGHDHVYERVNVGGLNYLVNGLGGKSKSDFADPVDGSQVRCRDEYGAVFLEADYKSKTLNVAFHSVEGDQVDEFTITDSGNWGGSDYLVQEGATWKYSDDGSDLGSSWKDKGYDDSTWSNGVGKLGYPEKEVNTVVSYGNDSNNKHITTYFRHSFEVSDASTIKDLFLRVLRDDGLIVYLNGHEVLRLNLPFDGSGFDMKASYTIMGEDEDTWKETMLSSEHLVTGTNTIAVEVHQKSSSSSDLIFDLELLK